jgi:hypothetical protein
MRSIETIDETGPLPKKGGVSLFELLLVVGILSVTVGGVAKYYGDRNDELLAVGTEKLVATLNETPMNEACPEQALGTIPNCRMFGDYRVRQTHDDSWTISRRDVDGGTSDVELVLVSGGKLYPSEMGARQMMSARFEAIKGVVGKSAAEIAKEKG